MPVSNDNFYKPEEALHELQVQETILKTAIDVQVALRILVDKEIVTREEMHKYREEVSNSHKYKIVLDDIKRQKVGFQVAKDNPQEYLQDPFSYYFQSVNQQNRLPLPLLYQTVHNSPLLQRCPPGSSFWLYEASDGFFCLQCWLLYMY